MKDGNNQKFGGEVGLGILSQSLMLEGPVIKNKASFIVSGRVSTLGATRLLNQKKKANGTGEKYLYGFYDLNAKFNYQINKTDQLFISFYNGFDRFSYEEWRSSNVRDNSITIGNNWGNTTGTIRYSKVLSQKLFARLAVLYSRYTSEFTNTVYDNDAQNNLESKFFRNTDAGVRDFGAKIQLDYFPKNNVSLKFGLDVTRHVFNPFTTATNYQTLQNVTQRVKLPALQMDGYVDGNLTLFKQLNLNAGLRYSLYYVKGRAFHNPEPRLGANWALPNNWTLKGGFSVMNQYLHLLTNNGYGFGYDAWVPSTDKVTPSRAWQTSAGVVKIFPKAGLEVSIEGYHKDIKNLIDYPEGTSFAGLLADSWENIVLKGGVGRVKGIELMINRTAGKLNGWVSYTFSQSERKFSELNDGAWFPMRYDRRHNLAVTGSYALGKKWKLSSTYAYQTGHAVTLPEAAIINENQRDPRFVYSKRNNARMPDYHRMDVGATRYLITPRGRKAALNLGLYNAYNRNNPVYLDFSIEHSKDENYKPTEIKLKQYALFPVLPYISYTLQF